MRRSTLLAAVISVMFGCSSTGPTSDQPEGAGAGGASGAGPTGWHVARGFLRDPEGRAVLARGMNLAGGHKFKPYLGWHTPADYARLHDEWGMSAIRFLVVWAAIEPEKGQFDEAYLDEVAKRMQWAKDAGLVVVLDMHQDVFGEGFAAAGFSGDGAPAWACDASRYASFKPESMWFLNYLSPEVTGCFDDFYASSELKSHYAMAWKKLAERTAGFDNIVGFDIMNEPFWGSHDPATFDRDVLQPFFEQVTVEVRKAAPGWVAFFEPSRTETIFVTTSMQPPGVRDVVFAPHAYQPSAEASGKFSPAGKGIFAKKFAEYQQQASSLGTALWIGEYGGIADGAGIDAYMDAAYDGAGQAAAAGTYWTYDKGGYGPLAPDGSERTTLLDSLVRPYPERVAGDLASYAHDRATGVFTMSWAQDPAITAPTIVSAPARAYPKGTTVECGGCEHHSEGGRLVITRAPAGPVTLTLAPAP